MRQLVRVSYNDDMYDIEIHNSQATVLFLKTELKEIIPIPRQTLKFKDKIMDEDKLLTEYEDIFDGDHVVYLFMRWNLIIIVQGEEQEIEVLAADRIHDIKEAVEKDLGFPAKSQDLYYKKRRLKYDEARLLGLKIPQYGRLELQVKYQVTIIMEKEDETLQLFIHGSWSTADFKETLCRMYGYDILSWGMIVDGVEVVDMDRSIEESSFRDAREMRITFYPYFR